MTCRNLFVQIHSQPRCNRRQNVSILPLNWVFQNLRVEATPCLYAFLNQEIRAAKTKLDVGRPLNGTTVQMRRNLRVMCFGHTRNLLCIQDSTDTSERELQDAGKPPNENMRKLVLGVNRSPVAIGMEVMAATRAIASTFAGGTGSSSQSG